VARVDGDRPLAGVDRLRQPSRRLKNDAEVTVAIRPIGIERQASPNKGDRFIAATLLMREHPRIVQGAGVIRGGLEHATEQLPGGDELVLLLQQDGELDRLVERQFAGRRF
jgi:hypothetical protein